MVELITQWPGHAAEEVERLITVPVERGVNGTPRMTALRSISLYGLSDVVMTFQNGTDNYFARQQVYNAMPGISLPTGITPSVSPMSSSPSGLIYRYVLQSPDRSPMELKTFERLDRRAGLSARCPAWRTIPASAAATMQYQVLLDPGEGGRRRSVGDAS